MNRYLITGGAGFVGANLVHRLVKNNHEVHVVVKKSTNLWRLTDVLKNICLHEVDILDENFYKTVYAIQPTVVYHLATRGAYEDQNNVTDIFRTNIEGTARLIKALKNVDLSLMVNIGSSSEYGEKKHPMRENDISLPNSYYAIAKLAQTQLCRYEADNGFPVVTLRLFSVYGEYEEPTRLMPTLMKHYDAGLHLKLARKNTARDFIYVQDVVDVMCMENKLREHCGSIFNIGTGIQTTLQELPPLFEALTGKKIPYSFDNTMSRKWDTTTWVADMSHTHATLGWKARVGLQQGLGVMWKWYNENKHHA